MAIIKCPECTENISTDAENCIHCGFSIKNYFDNELINIYSNAFRKCYSEEYPEIVKDFDEEYKENCKNSKCRFRDFCYMMDDKFNPMFSYILDVEKLKNISEKINEKIIDYTTSFFRPTIFLRDSALYYVIKKNNLSEKAVKDYGVFVNKNMDNRDHSSWIEKYSNLIRKVITDYPDELKVNIDLYSEEQLNKETQRKNSMLGITNYNIKEEYKSSKELYKSLDSALHWAYTNYRRYIYDKLFEMIKPTKDENFGALELCNYIKKNYNIKYEIEDIIGCVNAFFILNSSKKILSCYPAGDKKYITTADGKEISYGFYYYGTPQEYESYAKSYKYYVFFVDDIQEILADVEKKYIDENFEDILNKCFEDELTGNQSYPSYDEVCKARELALANLEDIKIDDESRKKGLELNERKTVLQETIEKTTLHFDNDGKKCPNCGSSSVEKISGLNRAVSVGLFGLASSKIGKTMQCKSCGYKW